MSTRSTFASIALGAAVLVSLGGLAEAAQRRRPSAAQIKAAQNQAAYLQLEMVRYQVELAQTQEALRQTFDEDGDGKIERIEQTKFDKHMRDIARGIAPNPFTLITPVGKGPRPRSPMDELHKRAAQYNDDFFAKQREILAAFDENGDGELHGAEKSRFDKHMHDIQTGKVPNPFATLAAPRPTTGAKP